MTLQEPAWRVRTRPCPFYQQGRCFFADSCNFLHTATFKAVSETHIRESNSTKDEHLSSQATPLNPPVISIESPHSVRSPRLSNLLLALKDVIGDDSNEDATAETSRQGNLSAGTNMSWSTNAYTLVNEHSSSGPSSPYRTIDNSPVDDLFHNDQHSFFDTPQNDGNTHIDSGSSSLPQHDFKYENDTLRINTSTIPEEDEEEEEYVEPIYAITRDDLLSPVEMSHVRLANFARMSADLTEHVVHQDDSQRPSIPLSLTSPRSSVRGSTFELLASPFGSPGSRVLSPRLSAFIGRNSHSTPDETAEDRQPHDSDLDSPSTRKTENADPPYCVTESSAISDETTVPSLIHHDVPLDIEPPEGEVIGGLTVKLDESIPLKDEVLDEGRTVKEEQGQILVQEGSVEQHEIPLMHKDEITKVETCDGNEIILGNESNEGPHTGSPSQWAMEAESTVICIGNQPLASKDVDAASECSNRSHLHSLEPQDESLEQEGSTHSPTSEGRLEISTVAAECASELFFPSINASAVPNPPSLHENDSGNHDLFDQEKASDNSISTGKSISECGVEMHDRDSFPTLDYSVLLPLPDGNQEEQVVEQDTRETYFDIYSGLSSPSLPSISPTDVQPGRSRDVSTGESSSISTPLSSGHERAFSPALSYGRNRPAEGSSKSPSSAGAASQPLADLGSPITITQGRDSGISSGSTQPHSPTEASRKVPLAWRSSVTSKHSNNSSRMSQPIPKPLAGLAHSHSPIGDLPSLSSSPRDAHPAFRLKPLRLSTLLTSQPLRSAPPFVSNHSRPQSVNRRMSLSSSTVPSTASTSLIHHNHSLSSARFSVMSDRIRTIIASSGNRTPSPLTIDHCGDLTNFGTPSSSVTNSHIWRRASIYSQYSQDEYPRTSSRLSERAFHTIEEGDGEDYDPEYIDEDEHIYNHIPPQSIRTPPHSAPVDHTVYQPVHAISTPKPDLMFAIASDDVTEVKRVLHSGDANPNDVVGPQTALEFALTNDQLSNKIEIVKTLLAYGADPAVIREHSISRNEDQNADSTEASPLATRLIDDVDPALKYYIERAGDPDTRRTSALIHRSFFRPLTKVRYELIGQDCVLEQLFRVLNIQSRGFAVAPVVVLLCGPSGHGKSLLARKFGSLLDVPTHTVNMTTLKSTQDIWRSHSMSPYETPTTCTLAEFLINNEGKRCVVVLDEIEKTDESTLWSLLMPWELGRCSFEAGTRHVDVRNVVWLGTSNIGHDLIFKYDDSRPRPDDLMGREEYLELMKLLRPLVSERLGASVLSRMTVVLPFVPFTLEEKKAISSEALFTLGGDSARALPIQTVESVIQDALTNYCATEGARSLYRAISNQLMEII